MQEFIIRTPRQLGPILQGRRKSRRLTQASLGQAVSVPQPQISNLELDPSSTSWGLVFKLLAALDLELVVRPRHKHTSLSEW